MKQQLNDTTDQLVDLKQQLNDSTDQLVDLKKQLLDLKNKLEKEINDLRNQLADTNKKLQERNTDRDTLLLGQLGFVYERLFIDALGLPQAVGSPDTIRDLEELLREDWTEYEVPQGAQQLVQDRFDRARKEYLTASARAAIRALKRHRVDAAHPSIDLSDDDTLRRLYAAIDSAAIHNREAVRALVTNAQRLQALTGSVTR